MSRNPDGTFKSGDPETRETARRGGEASGGSRQAQLGQRHAKRSQQSLSPSDNESRPESGGKFQDNSDRAREAGRKGGVATQSTRHPGIGEESDDDGVLRDE